MKKIKNILSLVTFITLTIGLLIMNTEAATPNTKDTKGTKDTKDIAVIHTDKGQIRLELYSKDAPKSVENFKKLIAKGFYNGLTFHRVVPGFVIQGGDPKGDGTGGPGYTIEAEIGKKHAKGALAYARTGDAVNPERRSSGSQFYIALEPLAQLDGQYTVFGQTIDGMDVVSKIGKGDKITKIVLE